MPYVVRPLRIEEHREMLLRLWRENFYYDPPRNAYAYERFKWLYEECSSDEARTWLAIETDSNTVAGCGSVIRSDRYIGGALVGAGMPVVFMVDAKHRTAGAALAIQRAIIQGGAEMGISILVAKPNRRSVPIFRRLGYQPIGDIYSWMKPLDVQPQFCPDPNPIYVDEIVDIADARFDRLWNSAKGRFPIVGEKTSAFLNWRFNGSRENFRYYCLLRRDDLSLVGYVLFYHRQKMTIVAELFCEGLAESAIDRVLHGFAARMKREGQEWLYLSYFGVAGFEDRLKQFGFELDAKRTRPLVAYVDPQIALEVRDVVLSKDNWYLFGDEIHITLNKKVWPNREALDSATLAFADRTTFRHASPQAHP